MANLKTFPIITTDRTGSELAEGVCPALCSDIAELGAYSSGSWYQDPSGNTISDLTEISAFNWTSGQNLISGYVPSGGTLSGYYTTGSLFISGYYFPSAELWGDGLFVSGVDITILLTYTTSAAYDTEPSTSAVVSEYGIRLALDDHVEDNVSGVNLGIGEGVFSEVDDGEVKLKSINTQTSNRITITSGAGYLGVNYNGSTQSFTSAVSSSFVQGGSQQMWMNISAVSGFETIILGAP